VLPLVYCRISKSFENDKILQGKVTVLLGNVRKIELT